MGSLSSVLIKTCIFNTRLHSSDWTCRRDHILNTSQANSCFSHSSFSYCPLLLWYASVIPTRNWGDPEPHSASPSSIQCFPNFGWSYYLNISWIIPYFQFSLLILCLSPNKSITIDLYYSNFSLDSVSRFFPFHSYSIHTLKMFSKM